MLLYYDIIILLCYTIILLSYLFDKFDRWVEIAEIVEIAERVDSWNKSMSK